MQAARVKIDEDGVEAAAYTELVCADSAGPPFLSIFTQNFRQNCRKCPEKFCIQNRKIPLT